MSSRTSSFRRRSSGIALLGASTILLAAAGETMWHAEAAASNRAWVAPAEEVEAAAASIAAAAEEEVTTMTEPLFKPFVFVELPRPTGLDMVQDAGVHMNDDGDVIATMNDGQDNHGYIWYDEEFAEGWQGPLNDGSNDIVLDSTGLAGINDDLEICGTRENSGDKAFMLALTSEYTGTLNEIGSGYAQDLNNYGVVVGTSVSGMPVGWSQASGSPVTLPAIAGGEGTAAIGVTPNTPLSTSLIVGQSEDATPRVQAVVWYSDGGWDVAALTDVAESEVGIAVDVNDNEIIIGSILTSAGVSDTLLWYYDATGDEWVEVSLNVAYDFFPEAINDETYPEIVGDKYLWVTTNVTTGAGVQFDMSAVSLGAPSNLINMRLTDISNAGEIVGVGQLGSAGDWIAFKLVPYDVDNNGVPDFREILDGSHDDENGNWLIDWAESIPASTPTGMRLGLHSPGSIAIDGKLNPVQIVRLKANIAPRTGLHPQDPEQEEDYYIDKMVAPSDPDCDNCENFTNLVDNWGTGDARPSPLTGEQCEILVRVHSMMGDEAGFGNNEGLPKNQTAHDEALEDLMSFGYRFAHCVDYVQWGNESFSTSSGYMFRDDDLQNGNCQWTGDPKKFSELDDGTSHTCREEAIGLVLAWQEDMMWATLRGSALAGRPLRMVTTGIINKNVRDGYEAGNAGDPESHSGYVGYYLTDTVTSWANENQMYFSMHTHYFTVAEAIEAIQKLVDTYDGAGSPWDVPNWRISTEVGAKADFVGDEWWDEGEPQSNKDIHNEFFEEQGEPGMLWEDFIGDWEEFSDHFASTGFGIDNVLDEFADSKFAAVCWSCLQFGSHNPPDYPSPFYVGAIRANRLTDDEFTNDPDKFTPMKSDYVTHGAGFYIDDTVFTPHDCPCDVEHTCPDCE